MKFTYKIGSSFLCLPGTVSPPRDQQISIYSHPIACHSLSISREEAPFQVQEISQFRLYCEAPDAANDVDVDFALLEDGVSVGFAIATKEEEATSPTILRICNALTFTPIGNHIYTEAR
jgi:hypothetical protein